MNNFENQTMNTYEINTRDKQYLPKSKDIEVGFFINKKNNVNKKIGVWGYRNPYIGNCPSVLHSGVVWLWWRN